ncbi:MAG: alginate O-acetyltransferase AlgX-related protein [Bacilli bacterium]
MINKKAVASLVLGSAFLCATQPTQALSYYPFVFSLNQEDTIQQKKAQITNGFIQSKNGYFLPVAKQKDGAMSATTKKNIDQALANLKQLASDSKKIGAQVYYVQTPHRTTALQPLYPSDTFSSIRKVEQQYFKSNVKNTMNFIDLATPILNEKKTSTLENWYFKTDHHWNGAGAKKGLEYFFNALKKPEVTKNLKQKNIGNRSFLGTYEKKLPNIKEKADISIPTFGLPASALSYQNATTNKKMSKSDIFQHNIANGPLSYADVYYQPSASNVLVKNKKASIKKRVVVFKDSYFGAMSYAVSEAFQETLIIDVRYLDPKSKSGTELLRAFKPDAVFVCYNNLVFDGAIFNFK